MRISSGLLIVGVLAMAAPLPAHPQRDAVTSQTPGPVLALQSLLTVSRETVVYRFKGGSDGFLPYNADLIADRTGALYGTTLWGGGGPSCSGRGCGTVFKLAPGVTGYTESVLYRFQGGLDGANPSGLVADSSGALYGTTASGGGKACREHACGTVFKLTPARSGYAETVLYRFHGGRDDGSHPYAGLIIDRKGALYGTTVNGGSAVCSGRCGTVFKLTPSASGYAESVLHRFGGVRDGLNPYARLILDENGALFGTTAYGGGVNFVCGGGCGTVFKLSPAGSGYAETVLHRFEISDGELPYGNLMAGEKGALYGTTSLGGSIGAGTVFKLAPTGSGYAETLLYSFQGGSDGGQPIAGVIADKSGAIYGTTWSGGREPYGGTVFKLTPTGSGYSETVLYRFQGGSDGYEPFGGLTPDGTGALFGMTEYGGIPTTECGTRGCGVVFEIIP
jgi:uncharacterized repeat protein (TIGR03803 family)